MLYEGDLPKSSGSLILLKNSTKIAFISAPIDAPDGYFENHYVPMLDQAIAAGHSFVVGPALGMDSKALQYLLERGVELSRITVYFTETEAKYMPGKQWFEGLGGNTKVEGIVTVARNATMTRDSDYDILRYMPVEEQKAFFGRGYYPRVSATEKNERRRKGLPLEGGVDLRKDDRTVEGGYKKLLGFKKKK